MSEKAASVTGGHTELPRARTEKSTEKESGRCRTDGKGRRKNDKVGVFEALPWYPQVHVKARMLGLRIECEGEEATEGGTEGGKKKKLVRGQAGRTDT